MPETKSFLCGLRHAIDDAPTLHEILDLAPDEEAEGAAVCGSWVR